mmetsp:Transcript_29633/g.46536  ORF Transcript_29633/g.46536 Transcript_29633/m.46536 type:complete len:399 (+) Transcript_29633:46-1242(+)
MTRQNCHHMSLLLPLSTITVAAACRRCLCTSASNVKLSSVSLDFVRNPSPAWRRHINNCHHLNRKSIINGGYRRRRAFSTKDSSSSSSSSASGTGCKNSSTQVKDKQLSSSNKHSGTITTTECSTPPTSTSSIEEQLSALQSEIAHLSYLIKQTSTQQLETASLSRRAEARAYIIEHKLMDIQSHVVKIPEIKDLTKSLRQYLDKYSPSLIISDAFQRASLSSGRDVLINKYTIWITLGSLFLFWQYRMTMYQRTSEEVADIAAMTLQQDTLRSQIQDTLATVANSPSTLASLSSLFQQLIREERTQQHLIDLIVRALGSNEVRMSVVELLDVSCFQNEELQVRAGEFLKVAAKVAVLDEGVQKSAGVGIQKALKSAVLSWWVVNTNDSGGRSKDGGR